MTDIELGSLTLPQLYDAQQRAIAEAVAAKSLVAEIGAEASKRFGASAVNALKQTGKDHGSIILPLQDGYAVKAELRRTIKWDSAGLMAVAKTLPWDRVEAMFKIEFSMPEAIYKGVAAFSPEMREKIDAARTTKVGEPILLIAKEA